MVRRIATAAALCIVGGAQASNTVTFIGLENSGADVVTAAGVGGSFYADTLQFSAAGTDVASIWGTDPVQFATVCADLPHEISGGDAYGATFSDSATFGGALQNGATIDGVRHAGSIVGYVGGLLAGANPGDPLSVLDATGGAGLQIAVWETLYDDVAPTTKADFLAHLTTGAAFPTNFTLNSGLTTAILDDAWADYSGGYGSGDDAIFIQATSHGDGGGLFQDQFAYAPRGGRGRLFTPEPITMSLGLAAIGLYVRRRTKKSVQS